MNHQKDEDGKLIIKWLYDLPTTARTLQRKYNQYLSDRYATFIHKGEGSQNARVVTAELESLIISLYCLPTNPYGTATYDMYLQFVGGAIDVYDVKTGEMFERERFFDKENQPLKLSEATIWNYINKPENQIIISKYRHGDYYFNHKIRPHVNRHASQYSMSKISLDDRDIMHHRLHNGDKVMAYYAFDVMSGAMIGIAHSTSKNNDLFLDCVRDMFRFIDSYGLGVPLEMEVERHLVSNFAEGLMKQGVIFPQVRWCNPANSQEKYAETSIRTKKYGVEKSRHEKVGRHYARLDSNRVIREKVFDEYNDNYKYAKATYDEIVAWELEEQILHNNELHSDQKKYPGKTRLQVFLENVNPNLPKINKPLLARYLGERTKTSIRRNQYVTVQYGKYQLPNPQVLTMLAPNNYNVVAYYMPENNEVKEVYLFQKDEFICKCKPAPTFNRAKSEWTDEDVKKYNEAMKFIQQFDAWGKGLKEDKLQKVNTMQATEPIDVECEIVEEQDKELELELETVDNSILVENKALNDL